MSNSLNAIQAVTTLAQDLERTTVERDTARQNAAFAEAEVVKAKDRLSAQARVTASLRTERDELLEELNEQARKMAARFHLPPAQVEVSDNSHFQTIDVRIRSLHGSLARVAVVERPGPALLKEFAAELGRKWGQEMADVVAAALGAPKDKPRQQQPRCGSPLWSYSPNPSEAL